MIKLTILIFFAFLTTISGASSSLDFADYELTTTQVELLQRLEQRGFSPAKLKQFAEVFEKSNKPKIPEYIPEHTKEDIQAVTSWAVGGAFYAMRKQAGVSFDRESYINDCPNWALFGFMKATGTEFIKRDVLHGHTNTMFALSYHYRQDPEQFPAYYLALAHELGFSSYITVNRE